MRIVLLGSGLFFFAAMFGQSRVIRGKLLSNDLLITGLYLEQHEDFLKFRNIGDSLDYSHILDNGCFEFSVLQNTFSRVVVNFKGFVTIEFIHIPLEEDTINLGIIDLVRYREISVRDYLEIKNGLSQPDNLLMRLSDGESQLNNRYIPIRDGICGFLIGYRCLDELERYEIIDPWNESKRMKVNIKNPQKQIIVDYISNQKKAHNSGF